MNPLNCYHCGEPAPGQPAITLELDGELRHFCCQGCKAVCETIRAEGLDGFYQFRTEPAVTPKELTDAELNRIRELDHPLVQKSFVSPVKSGQEATLLISDITCAACIWLLENHMAKQPGVMSFSVNHSTQRARLVWNPEQARLSDLLVAIHELGYRARPYQADEAERALKAEHRSALIRLAVAGIGSFQTMMLAFPLYFELVSELSPEFVSFFRWFSLLVATPVVLYSARPFFTNAVRDLRSRHLTMDVPVATAIGLAYVASIWVTVFGGEEVYFESVCMFTFFLQLGRYIEMQARYRAGLTGNALAGFQPMVASRVRGNDSEIVSSHDLATGDLIRVRPGETLPADGVIVSGHSTLNEAALTGEYLPETRNPGDEVHAGSVNGENPLEVEVRRAGAQTRLSGILRILDRVQAEKPPVALMADRIAGVFVSRVLVLAPVIWIGWWLAGADNAFDITLSVLVVTCPCALSLATPTAITSATMRLRKLGLLPTRGHTLESLNTIDTVIFDKTGTLTRGELSLVDTRAFGPLSQEQCLETAASLEKHSEHPIARVFHNFHGNSARNVQNHLGGGLCGELAGQCFYIGHRDFVEASIGQPPPASDDQQGMEIWLANDSQWLARFTLDDEPRPEAREAVQMLQQAGLRTILLSGDRSGHVAQIAKRLGIDEAIGQASPEDKLQVLEALRDQGRHIMMVGDGLNDLPSMAGAGVSVAMGSAADLTQLKADAVLLNGQLTQLPEALKTARRTRRIIRQNMAWALGYNLCALPLAAAGLVPPWLAAIGMSLSSLVVVLNAMRLGRAPERAESPTPAVGAEATS
ncbi:heavy metal translocating P-type ATPase [Marinobacter sp. SS13-12]|uniref:heavy metal translocating P-type ATPase n=1 Tax=Marinobacter sp. SS13-12 TaxID=3050451 RepID=UPI002553B7B6|nr:heavy metal translocating P-type ATPase [Marinobacter sp. SS13-12]MDK8464120.1 heavy metal translocating P-type ATPase [Marinobacter sp. SS13-12]